jgi:hypothetical protein
MYLWSSREPAEGRQGPQSSLHSSGPPDYFGITGEWIATSAPKNQGGSCASRNRDKGTPPNQRLGSFPFRASPTIYLVNPVKGSRRPRGLTTPQDLLAQLGPRDHRWVERNISSEESKRVLCQEEKGQRNPIQPDLDSFQSGPARRSSAWTRPRA